MVSVNCTTYCFVSIEVASCDVPSAGVNAQRFAESSNPNAVPTPFAPVVTINPPSPLVEPLGRCAHACPRSID